MFTVEVSNILLFEVHGESPNHWLMFNSRFGWQALFNSFSKKPPYQLLSVLKSSGQAPNKDTDISLYFFRLKCLIAPLQILLIST